MNEFESIQYWLYSKQVDGGVTSIYHLYINVGQIIYISIPDHDYANLIIKYYIAIGMVTYKLVQFLNG